MARKASPSGPSITSTLHKDKRVNIPTRELRDFVAEEEARPGTLLYPRDPSLDPQLVWQGKDEQDGADLAVPVVPVYIQEKIRPQEIIDDLRRELRAAGGTAKTTGSGPTGTSAAGAAEPDQLEMFSDFNGLPERFEDRVDFYHHEGNWQNRLILGDSQLVMASLAEKEGLKGRVQMIYLDPPYGIKFGSNWQVSTRKRDVKDGKAEDLTRQPEQIRAFRDTWKLGIHSYLAYLRDRLVIARDLLTDSGSVFVQIGDENVHLVRCVMDEIFGSENFVSQICYRTKNMTFGGMYLETINDFILFYAKDKEKLKFRQLFRATTVEGDSHWNMAELSSGIRKQLTAEEIADHSTLTQDVLDVCQLGSLYPAGVNESGLFSFIYQGKKYEPPIGKSWKTNETGLNRLIHANRVEPYKGGQTIRWVMRFKDYPVSTLPSFWADTAPPSGKNYVVETATGVITRCLLMTTDPGDLVLDPTCGSGTTAYVAEQWGRRWITTDTSRVALALARTRLMSGRYPYYLLADSAEGVRKEAELTAKTPPPYATSGDIRKGFVYKRVPHITLKSIANNEEIDTIHAAWQPRLEEVRAKLNKALRQKWEEWEIPREADTKWSQETKLLLRDWWSLRRDRQAEIDASIARAADTEYLFDQPYEDGRTVRVCGPFTVESLSPHRILPADEDGDGIVTPREEQGRGDFTTIILDNLKSAGVQNTRKGERLRFETIEPYPGGPLLHAQGTFTDKDGHTRRVALHIGPEHGTVRAEDVKEAAKQAVAGVGFDMLIVLGLAFDAHASETAREFRPQSGDGFAVAEDERKYGRLPVLLTRINPDLAMGDEVLKKTGAGNLFMVFGEPDLDVVRGKDGRLTVRLKGVDIYDPTTGQIRSSSTNEIACWFIDTDYSGEAFFVRHAYFTGGDEPYDKLKRALRAEIDETAWAALYSTESRPFDAPTGGKIAVKVINHYGDEVLKVYEVK